MPTSRVVLSAPAQADIDRLLAAAIHQAKQQLADSSEFTPFAIVIDRDGRLLAADIDMTSLGKHPDSDQIADATTTRLRTIAPIVRCTALTVNTRLSARKTDAVEVRLEHREGAAILVLLPYKRPRFAGVIEFGELALYSDTPVIWI